MADPGGHMLPQPAAPTMNLVVVERLGLLDWLRKAFHIDGPPDA